MNPQNFPSVDSQSSDAPHMHQILYFSQGSETSKKEGREIDLPSQLLFKYTDTNTGGTVKKSTTEFTSSQNHSLSLAAINWGKEKRRERKKTMRSMVPAFKLYSFAKGYVLLFHGGLEGEFIFFLYLHQSHAIFVFKFAYTL